MALKDFADKVPGAFRLMQSVEQNTVSHAYIFESSRAVDKKGLAENFAKAILCQESSADSCDDCPVCRKIDHGNYEDLFYVGGEGANIKDEEVEQMQAVLKKKPVAGEHNIVIIEQADSMTPRAQNRLLKTLEEPFPGTVIILLCENIEALVSTILSRCIIYRLTAAGVAASRSYCSQAEIIGAMMLDGERFYKISAKLGDLVKDRDAAIEFLGALEEWFRDLLVAPFDKTADLVTVPEELDNLREKSRLYRRERIYKGILNAEAAKRELKSNMNVSYTLKSMILQMY